MAIEIFIFYALTIDLYKWCIFIAATSKTEEHNYEEILAKRKRLLSVVFLAVSLIILSIYVVVVDGVMSTSTENPNQDNK